MSLRNYHVTEQIPIYLLKELLDSLDRISRVYVERIPSCFCYLLLLSKLFPSFIAVLGPRSGPTLQHLTESSTSGSTVCSIASAGSTSSPH